jgi:hypothetical protein
VPLLNVYPLFLALAGFAASALLYERALGLLHADAKAALIDASARTRMLSLLAAALFVALVMWRPVVAWVFLACAYLGLGVRSLFRLRRLGLPPYPARLLLIGNICAVAGITLCAGIFATRALQ